MSTDNHEFFTFWGKLKKNHSLVTSEGTLHHVIHEECIPHDVYGFFLVEKRGKAWIIKKYLSETILRTLVCED